MNLNILNLNIFKKDNIICVLLIKATIFLNSIEELKELYLSFTFEKNENNTKNHFKRYDIIVKDKSRNKNQRRFYLSLYLIALLK